MEWVSFYRNNTFYFLNCTFNIQLVINCMHKRLWGGLCRRVRDFNSIPLLFTYLTGKRGKHRDRDSRFIMCH